MIHTRRRRRRRRRRDPGRTHAAVSRAAPSMGVEAARIASSTEGKTAKSTHARSKTSQAHTEAPRPCPRVHDHARRTAPRRSPAPALRTPAARGDLGPLPPQRQQLHQSSGPRTRGCYVLYLRILRDMRGSASRAVAHCFISLYCLCSNVLHLTHTAIYKQPPAQLEACNRPHAQHGCHWNRSRPLPLPIKPRGRLLSRSESVVRATRVRACAVPATLRPRLTANVDAGAMHTCRCVEHIYFCTDV